MVSQVWQINVSFEEFVQLPSDTPVVQLVAKESMQDDDRRLLGHKLTRILVQQIVRQWNGGDRVRDQIVVQNLGGPIFALAGGASESIVVVVEQGARGGPLGSSIRGEELHLISVAIITTDLDAIDGSSRSVVQKLVVKRKTPLALD